jgi:hypothetical protein
MIVTPQGEALDGSVSATGQVDQIAFAKRRSTTSRHRKEREFSLA